MRGSKVCLTAWGEAHLREYWGPPALSLVPVGKKLGVKRGFNIFFYISENYFSVTFFCANFRF